MRLSTVAANKAGSINVFSIKAVPVMLPIIIGLRIVPEVMEPVAISIPIIMGISIPMVLAIVVTESIASVYVVLKLFIDMPTITMEPDQHAYIRYRFAVERAGQALKDSYYNTYAEYLNAQQQSAFDL